MVVVRRPLAPGSYRVVASAPGFANATAEVTVPQVGLGAQQVTLGRRFQSEHTAALALPVVPPAGVCAAGREECQLRHGR